MILFHPFFCLSLLIFFHSLVFWFQKFSPFLQFISILTLTHFIKLCLISKTFKPTFEIVVFLGLLKWCLLQFVWKSIQVSQSVQLHYFWQSFFFLIQNGAKLLKSAYLLQCFLFPFNNFHTHFCIFASIQLVLLLYAYITQKGPCFIESKLTAF